MEEAADVVVVGGGLAGLYAARILQKRAPQLKVVVLEAKDRVGGRTQTCMLKTVGGGQEGWDMGGHTQNDPLKVETYEQYSTGRKLAQIGGTAIRGYSDSLPTNSDLLQYSVWEALDFLRFFTTAEYYATKVGLGDPFAHPKAADWDSETVDGWTRRHCWTKTLRDSAELVCRSVFGTSASRISMLYFLAYGNAGGAITNLLEAVGDGAQRMRIKGIEGGSQQLSRMMMDDLGGPSAVRLSRVVSRIDQDSRGATVFHTSAEHPEAPPELLKCGKVIIAAPPQQAGKISFAPPLPESRHQLLNAFPQGNLLKFVATYERAFWRDAGLSGEIVAVGYSEKPGEILPLSISFDGTSDSGAPAIVGFYNSEWSEKPPTVRKTALLRDLGRFLGPLALSPVDFLDKDWAAEPFSGGCPVGILPPGYMGAFASIREPLGRLHWAGTESAVVWTGYMDGALQSGRRAAAEVLRDLCPDVGVDEGELEGSVYAAAFRAARPKSLAYAPQRLLTPSRLFWASVALGAAFCVAKRFHISFRL